MEDFEIKDDDLYSSNQHDHPKETPPQILIKVRIDYITGQVYKSKSDDAYDSDCDERFKEPEPDNWEPMDSYDDSEDISSFLLLTQLSDRACVQRVVFPTLD